MFFFMLNFKFLTMMGQTQVSLTQVTLFKHYLFLLYVDGCFFRLWVCAPCVCSALRG